MEINKKKRSPNYTLEEKHKLLSLVAKYTGIVESKRTGTFFLNKKNEAWADITNQFNSFFPTIPRNAAMLKHFYNNIKHRSRKNHDKNNEQNSHIEVITESVLEDQDIKTINTDEEALDPILSNPEPQTILLYDEHGQPNEVPLDESAEYFDNCGTTEDYIMDDSSSLAERITKKHIIPITRRKELRNPKNEFRKTSTDLLTRVYLKRKIDLLFYQKRNEMQRYKHEQEKHELELKKQVLHVQILKAQLEAAEMDLIKKYKINS